MRKVGVAIAISFFAACGGQQQGDGPCGQGRTLVDNVCVAEKVADFIVCIRSRGEVALKTDQSRGLTAEAQIVGQKVSTVMEAKDQLEAKYTTQGGAEGERQVIEQCAAMVKETQPAAGALPASAASPSARGNAIFFEDFSGVAEGGAPQGWLGAEHHAVKKSARGQAQLSCFEKGVPRFTVPTGALPPDVRIEIVTSLSGTSCGGARVESGSLAFGYYYDGSNLAFVNQAKHFIGEVPLNVPVTLALEKRGDVARVLIDGREQVMARYPDAGFSDSLIISLNATCGVSCNAGDQATLHRVAIYPL